MPSRLKNRATKADLARALDAPGEKEYRRLLRVLKMAQGRYTLLPVESDFSPALRDAFFQRLREDLTQRQICLRVLALSRDRWDVLALPEMETPVTKAEVVVLIGLEDTPGIVPEAGAKPRRPPALDLLNQRRETLRARLPAPFLVWCEPFVYDALLEHAPDFFDQYTGLFRFRNAVPPTQEETTETPRIETEPVIARPDYHAGSRAAVAFYEKEVAANPEPTSRRARALIGLADALWDLRDAERNIRLLRAERLAREALTLLSPESDDSEWARGQGTLGLILSDLPTGERGANLQQAIACYEAALCVYTEKDFPQDWAATQNNLGNAYSILSTGNRGANLQRAIACYEAALCVYAEKDLPQDWAATQNNLGNAYLNLPTGDREVNLQRAIACYEAALRVYTEKDFPQDWAMIQNNLGTAYLNLPTGDQKASLQRAIACYEAALRVTIEKDFPQDWAATQANLGIALEQKGDVEGARQAWMKAAAGYRKVGLEAEAQKMEAWIATLPAE